MSRFITAVFTLLVVASASASAQIVIGDSISAKQDSWPKLLESQYSRHIMVDALSLRTAYFYEVPGDLYPRDHDTVIYYLGTNDMAFGSVEGFTEKFNTHMNTLLHKGFTVLVLIPADYSREDLSAEIRTVMLYTCAVMSMLTQPVSCLDLDAIWDETLTIDNDGIHPLPALHQIIADAVEVELVAGE